MSGLSVFKRVLARQHIIRECSTRWTYYSKDHLQHQDGVGSPRRLKQEGVAARMVVRLGRCGLRCGKAVLLVFNLVFFVTGLAVVVVGVWCVAGEGRDVMLVLAPTPAHTPTLTHLAYGLVAVGGVVLLTSALGVWAALRENQCGLGLVTYRSACCLRTMPNDYVSSSSWNVLVEVCACVSESYSVQ
nr:uncharacterized protein LOC123745930 [Procambarus clarkii]